VTPLSLCRRLSSTLAWTLSLTHCLSIAATADFKTDASAANYSYDVWPIEEGWQQNTVIAITQTRDGYLWLGTYNGLVRYDGVKYTVFDSLHVPGLHNSRVTSLFEDAGGILWIGHETGELTHMSQGVFEAAPLGRAWPGGAIEAINSDENGDLWLLSDNGILFRVRDGHQTEAPGGPGPSRKASLTKAQNGKLWVVCNGTVATLESGRISPFAFDAAGPTDFFQNVTSARDGALWTIAGGRIRKWGEGRWVADLGTCSSGQASVTSMLETRSGALLVGTLNEGLYLMAPGGQPLHFSRTNGLSHDWVRALSEDHEGNLWVGTGGGLDSLRVRKVRMLSPPDGWEGRAVLSLSVRADGSAWIGTEGAGVYHFEHDDWTRYQYGAGLSNLFVWSVLETRKGDVYLGTWGGGITHKNGDRFESTAELNTITAPVLALFESRDGALWVGTATGVHRYEDGHFNWSAGADKLELPNVRAIAESPDGTMWFGMSGGGLASLKNGVLKQLRKRDGFPSDFVVAITVEPGGTMWIGTSDNGLVRFRDGKSASLNTAHGLPNNAISHVVDDGAGNFWMGCNLGIFRASKAELNDCADGHLKSVRCLRYGKAEGLLAMTSSGGFQPGACKTAQGLLWFPMTRGLAVINPVNVSINAVPPPVAIEDLIVEGEPVDLTPRSRVARNSAGVLEIPPGRQRFEIRFAALSFTAPDKVRFKYRLDGLEPGWMEGSGERVARYSYLPAGAYNFQVNACNNDDVWNDQGTSLSFVVLPEIWQTWWFRSAAVVVGAAAVGGVVLAIARRRVHRKLERLERQRALERERARIARDIHDDLGASLTRITLLSQSARGELAAVPEAAADLDQIYGTARELTRAMDEIVWAVNPKHDTLDSLVTYLGRFAQHFLSVAGIRCRLDVPLQLPPLALTTEIRHNVFLALKEALNNAVKHATASEVRIALEVRPPGFVLSIADNGCGFDWNASQGRGPARSDTARPGAGNGLLNMRRRLEEVGGSVEWDTAPGHGTRVTFIVAIKS